ncbi:MAG: hypothetical protein ABEK16_00235 [Candidatus Nanohalobium sp.]
MRWIDMVEDGRVAEYLDQGNLKDVDSTDVFRVLGSESRRDVVDFLYSTESGSVTLDELAEETSVSRTRLHHSDLSYLENLGALEYEEDSHEIRYDPETVEALSNIIESFEI